MVYRISQDATANMRSLKNIYFHYTHLIFPCILKIHVYRLKIFQGPATSSAEALMISVAC